MYHFFCFAMRRGYLRRAASLLGHILQYAPSRRLARRGVPHPHGFAKGAELPSHLARSFAQSNTIAHSFADSGDLPPREPKAQAHAAGGESTEKDGFFDKKMSFSLFVDKNYAFFCEKRLTIMPNRGNI
ncbi:MAG: hypothetical protein J6Y54_05850 [Lentisphaeria bacterium]|nr:hypothetical protein [Lentisphaeria bacterium]